MEAMLSSISVSPVTSSLDLHLPVPGGDPDAEPARQPPLPPDSPYPGEPQEDPPPGRPDEPPEPPPEIIAAR
jgi:hypothetical protein